jgi:hypothetical protein
MTLSKKNPDCTFGIQNSGLPKIVATESDCWTHFVMSQRKCFEGDRMNNH